MNITFCYSATTAFPTDISDQSKTVDVAWANDKLFNVRSVKHELINMAEPQDVVGYERVLKFRLGPGILKNPTDQAWFIAFFQAAYKWAVYGDFKDTANSAHSNLCACHPSEDDIEVNVPYDNQTGYVLVSDNVYPPTADS